MSFKDILEKEAKDMGAAYFGVADLALTRGGAITPNESRLVSKFPSAISIGVPLISTIVDSINDQTDIYALHNYRFHINQAVNPLIDQITRRLSSILMSDGHSALPISSTGTVDTKNRYSVFSHKIAASLSGLGWIGKNCLLITPDRGPRVRWGTILTEASLESGSPMEVKCGTCTECVRACPAQAFTGKNFISSEPRETRLIINNHIHYVKEREQTVGISACGMCVSACPFGKVKEGKK